MPQQRGPDTLLIVPERDQLVLPSGTFRFAAEAEKAGVTIDLVEIPLAMHAHTSLAYDSMGSQGHPQHR